MHTTLGNNQQQTATASPNQIGKMIQQMNNPSHDWAQRLVRMGVMSDLAKADLMKVNRFDLCEHLNVRPPFQVIGHLSCIEHEVEVDQKIGISNLLKKVKASDHFGNITEEDCPKKSRFFAVSEKGYPHPTMESMRQQFASYDLIAANLREFASFMLVLDFKLPKGLDYIIGWPLYGINPFAPTSYPELIYTLCDKGKMESIYKRRWDAQEVRTGDRHYSSDDRGSDDGSRRYLVRRMTHEEVQARFDQEKAS